MQTNKNLVRWCIDECSSRKSWRLVLAITSLIVLILNLAFSIVQLKAEAPDGADDWNKICDTTFYSLVSPFKFSITDEDYTPSETFEFSCPWNFVSNVYRLTLVCASIVIIITLIVFIIQDLFDTYDKIFIFLKWLILVSGFLLLIAFVLDTRQVYVGNELCTSNFTIDYVTTDANDNLVTNTTSFADIGLETSCDPSQFIIIIAIDFGIGCLLSFLFFVLNQYEDNRQIKRNQRSQSQLASQIVSSNNNNYNSNDNNINNQNTMVKSNNEINNNRPSTVALVSAAVPIEDNTPNPFFDDPNLSKPSNKERKDSDINPFDE